MEIDYYYDSDERGCCLRCEDAHEGCLCFDCKCSRCFHYNEDGGSCGLAWEFSQKARKRLDFALSEWEKRLGLARLKPQEMPPKESPTELSKIAKHQRVQLDKKQARIDQLVTALERKTRKQESVATVRRPEEKVKEAG